MRYYVVRTEQYEVSQKVYQDLREKDTEESYERGWRAAHVGPDGKRQLPTFTYTTGRKVI